MAALKRKRTTGTAAVLALPAGTLTPIAAAAAVAAAAEAAAAAATAAVAEFQRCEADAPGTLPANPLARALVARVPGAVAEASALTAQPVTSSVRASPLDSPVRCALAAEPPQRYCSSGHVLARQKFEKSLYAEEDQILCNKCLEPFHTNHWQFKCEVCDFDLCSACAHTA